MKVMYRSTPYGYEGGLTARQDAVLVVHLPEQDISFIVTPPLLALEGAGTEEVIHEDRFRGPLVTHVSETEFAPEEIARLFRAYAERLSGWYITRESFRRLAADSAALQAAGCPVDIADLTFAVI